MLLREPAQPHGEHGRVTVTDQHHVRAGTVDDHAGRGGAVGARWPDLTLVVGEAAVVESPGTG